MPEKMTSSYDTNQDDDCKMNVLSADDLVLVFQFLSLYERFTAMRVCKAWHSLLSQKSAWSYIDFTEKGPVQQRLTTGRLKITYTTQWRFPNNESDVFKLLVLYAGGSLREIRLNVVTANIMRFLRKNCPNVRFLALTGGKSRNFTVDKSVVKEMLTLPSRIIRCEIESPAMPDSYADHEMLFQRQSRDEDILCHLAEQRNLKYVKLSGLFLSQIGMESLAKKGVSMKGLHIISPLVFSDPNSLDFILTQSIGALLKLDCLKIECPPTTNIRKFHTLQTLPSSIAHYQNLQILSLKGVDCSEEAFKTMLPGLLNLESLQLEGRCVTTTAVSLLGQQKSLKVLELANGFYSNESLQSLAYHPTLQKLWICKDYAHRSHVQPSWVSTILDGVLPTLSELKHAKVEGYNISDISSFDQGAYPALASVQIDIIDVHEELLCE